MIERKTFTYDGVNSADYGLYIAGDSVYDAPTRDMDMITIPGRNGQLSIDQGRFENITVTYPAFIWADTQAEFRQKVRAIRNWLTPKHSYYRLTDEYNPESFRLGIYKSGLEVDPIFYNRAGRFELSFDCKPQRFLFTGEEVFTLGQWGETETYSGSIVSFDGTETTAIKSLKVNITPKQSGSGDPSPSNVRPISGYEGVNVEQRGKNLLSDYGSQLPYSNLGVSITGSGGEYTMVVNNASGCPFTRICTLKGLKKGTYRISSNAPVGGARIMNRSVSPAVSIGDETNRFIITEDITDDLAVELAFTGSQLTNGMYYIKVQLELGSTATAYEPYDGSTITTNLPQTVYGGTLDVVSGELTIDRASITLNGTESGWDAYSSGDRLTFLKTISGKMAGRDSSLCDKYKNLGNGDAYGSAGQGLYLVYSDHATLPRVYFRPPDSTISTLEAFKNWLTSNPLTLVYELATPTEIQLTPTEVKTLLGTNNIWADAGTVEVEVGENPNILVNPTPFTAQPVFEVEGSGTLTVGNVSMTIANNGTTIIDSEMMEAYEEENGAIISRNDTVSGEFPTLKEGNNNIGTVGLTSVKVTPRWWEL